VLTKSASLFAGGIVMREYGYMCGPALILIVITGYTGFAAYAT